MIGGAQAAVLTSDWLLQDRTSGSVEDDLILMPDDVEFKAVPACTTGRVFVLKFKGNDKKMFFWMQVLKIIINY